MAQRRGHCSDFTVCTSKAGVRGQWERKLAGEQSEHCPKSRGPIEGRNHKLVMSSTVFSVLLSSEAETQNSWIDTWVHPGKGLNR